ncbi:unnamed protein product [Pleuronectes platessa]|uniref:Uncharacterized protein n=1 Tax=Pleuronectes platessa TaxID=8262 RepID=A0A9N7TU38_PLEPL|nr:unnamed protein product [Pleuronectes platessa]
MALVSRKPGRCQSTTCRAPCCSSMDVVLVLFILFVMQLVLISLHLLLKPALRQSVPPVSAFSVPRTSQVLQMSTSSHLEASQWNHTDPLATEQQHRSVYGLRALLQANAAAVMRQRQVLIFNFTLS